MKMNLAKIYHEEDLFPREITTWESREYGILFYNTDNPDSYDSNHAVIFKERISDLKEVLQECGFKSWTEAQRFMVKREENIIQPNPEIVVEKVSQWKEEFASEIFEKAGEPWEIGVAKRALSNGNTLFFVAFYQGKPVGMLHSHVTKGVCRGDYLLVSKEHRNMGVGRLLMHAFVENCNANQIEDCFLWTDGETAERIYNEAGFRYVETKHAGRAVYVE